jgi:hypothetical protein
VIRLLWIVTSVLAMLATAHARAGGEPAPARPAATSAASNSETLSEVTVTANRIELERRVSNFVNQIAAAENGGEGLARWEAPPVCPLVSGLPQRDGEFILERLSQIAHGAGVPLADERCHPNLYILVTSQPEELLRGMEKRNRQYTFGYDASFYPPTEVPAALVDEFIKTPRAVRVWYNSAEKYAWGKPLAYCATQEIFSKCVAEHRTAACDSNQYYQCSSGTPGGSHLVFSTVWTFSRVFVIVDQTRLKQVKLGQLADYVAMAGLAKLKPDTHLDDAPTILKLFDAAPQAAPTGMTEWDQTFLKSLYATEQKSRLQRGQIARSMVREIAP